MCNAKCHWYFIFGWIMKYETLNFQSRMGASTLEPTQEAFIVDLFEGINYLIKHFTVTC